MPVQQPILTDPDGRPFACFPTVVLVFIVDDGKLLLLSDPERLGRWQVIKGAIEAGESILDGALREVREEAGPEVRVRPLGTVHAQTLWRDGMPYVVVHYLMAYEGGEIQPGDDMLGSQVRWWDPTFPPGLEDPPSIRCPRWLVERAVELARLWDGRTVDLQEVYREKDRR
jgi:8-oxo-dGTP diphosphatase